MQSPFVFVRVIPREAWRGVREWVAVISGQGRNPSVRRSGRDGTGAEVNQAWNQVSQRWAERTAYLHRRQLPNVLQSRLLPTTVSNLAFLSPVLISYPSSKLNIP